MDKLKHKKWGEKNAEGEERPHVLSAECWCKPEVVKVEAK